MKRKQTALAAVMAAWALALAAAGGVLLTHTARWSSQPVPQAAASAPAAPTLPPPPTSTDSLTPAPTSSQTPIVEEVSNEALLQKANDRLSEQWFFLGYLKLGAVFEQDWENGAIADGNGEWWFRVADPQVSTLADVQTVWETYFAKSCAIPDEYLDNYREIDGVLYTHNQGVGGDEGHIRMAVTAVAERTDTYARLTGYELREDLNSGEQYSIPIEYIMVPEDSTWKCAGLRYLEQSIASEMAPVLSQAEKIQTIRDWYQEIRGFQLRAVHFGDAAGAYWHGDDLVICEYYEEGDVDLVNPIGTTYRYYYRDGEPFFAHFTGVDRIEGNALRLYFWDGELIRWKENQDAPHDGSHAIYADYYEQAVYHYNNMVDMPNGLEY